MKKHFLLTLVSIISLSICTAQNKISIDIKNSSVKWIGEKVTGTHSGTIQLKEAFFLVENEQINGGTFSIDMNTIKCTDIESPTYATKLENHLKNNDFFAVDKYPESTLEITKVIFDGISYMINANITIRDIQKEISFPAQFHNENGIFTANARLKINRTSHDIKYGSGTFFDELGDRMIYDDFIIEVQLKSL